MKNKKTAVVIGSICLVLAMFAGCGERSGEKEYSKAMSAWEKGDLVRARTLLEKSIRKSSGNEKKSAAWNQLGLILWELQEDGAAAEAFSKSCSLSEELTGANLNLGIALFHEGRLAEAEMALNNVAGENPQNQTALTILGLIEMQKSNWAGAVQTTAKSASINPRTPAAQNALALSELHAGRNSDAAINRLKQILATHPNYAPAAYNLGAIYEQWLSNKSAAMGWYKDYLQRTATDGSHVEAAKQAIARLGGRAAPTADLSRAVQFMGEGAKLHAEKRYAQAIEQYQKAVQADPNAKNAQYNMGLAYYSLGKYTETAQACTAALKLDPNFADARYMLSLSYFQLKQWDRAKQEAEILKRTDPSRAADMLKHISNARK
ncbi:tetratricopeptide repeat protein [Pontiella sulfatireligans]|uniref:Uncharacterized protein n=1 Tax=Pontiella sulfatireligans TaxID=2750658 RepID=A0A6C2ULF6_9BACT|nr:tetratricopeptide repeat protein [Pontiella sulfatireligans]VGO20938.1 hypothetical protein SCARR_03005 [Pontiella sulfatireligans]